MEDVLAVYHRPHDPRRPVVCLDECSKQLIGEVRSPLPASPAKDDRPGRIERFECEYVRNGTANLFMAFEPLGGWREMVVTDQRRRVDWARFVRDLVDGRYRQADKLVLVMDQLNTHSPASLYEAFAPAEAKRVADRLEIHHTPKHGSWLNMAEIEPSALGRDPGLRRGRLCRTGWATERRWSATSTPGSTGVTLPPSGPIGNSRPRTPASSSVNSTRH
jgi:DDE superfamily endonuclease